MDLDAIIAALTARQSGLAATWQLRRLGLTWKATELALRRVGLRPHRIGVHRDPSAPDDWAQRTWGAVLASIDRDTRTVPATAEATWRDVHHTACTTVGATGLTALHAHGLLVVPPEEPQLLVPHDHKRHLRGIRVVRTRRWPSGVGLVGDVPSVGVVRALWDAAWLLRCEPGAPARLAALIGRADGARLLRAEDLWDVACRPAAHGMPLVVPEAFRIAAFRCARTHSHSGAEHLARTIADEVCADLGAQPEPRPHEIPVAGGRSVEVDIAIPRLRTVIEIDGPHHDDPAQRRWDQRRDAWLRAAGWTVLRYPAAMVTDEPDAFRRALQADLDAVVGVAT